MTDGGKIPGRFLDNALAMKLGEIYRRVETFSSGDDIDRGLILRRLLEEEGFGLVLLEESAVARERPGQEARR